MGHFIFNGHSTRDFGLGIQYIPPMNGAGKDMTFQSIPGRNGDLIVDNKRFNNIAVPYDAYFKPEWKTVKTVQMYAREIKAWLLGGAASYHALEDTYNPKYFRLAAFSGPIDIENRLNLAGRALISFNCKPQLFSKDGQHAIKPKNESVIYNPEAFTAKPLIVVYGSGGGNLYINNTRCILKEIDEYIVVDSDIENAYKGLENKNQTVDIDPFPTLQPGDNSISWDGGVDHIEVTPRWWTI